MPRNTLINFGGYPVQFWSWPWHTIGSFVKRFGVCWGSTVLTAGCNWPPSHGIPTFVCLSAELSHNRSLWVLDSDKAVCELSPHHFIVYILKYLSSYILGWYSQMTEDGKGKLMHGLEKNKRNPAWVCRSVVRQHELSKTTKPSICKSVFVLDLTYGHESWVITERVLQQVQAAEVGLLRRIEGMTRRDKVHFC